MGGRTTTSSRRVGWGQRPWPTGGRVWSRAARAALLLVVWSLGCSEEPANPGHSRPQQGAPPDAAAGITLEDTASDQSAGPAEPGADANDVGASHADVDLLGDADAAPRPRWRV